MRAVLLSSDTADRGDGDTASGAPQNPVVTGTVFASDGAVIPGATVVISELRGGVFRQIATRTPDSSGSLDVHEQGEHVPVRYQRAQCRSDDGDPRDGKRRRVHRQRDAAVVRGDRRGRYRHCPEASRISGATVELFRRNTDGTWPAAALRKRSRGSGRKLLPSGRFRQASTRSRPAPTATSPHSSVERRSTQRPRSR